MLQTLLLQPVITTMTKTTGSSRRPLFKPQYAHLHLRINENDLRLLNFIHQYRVLTTTQIRALLPDWPWNSLRTRLTELFHHGLVDRPAQQRVIQLLERESWNMIYAPTKKGLAAIDIDTKTRFDTKNARLSPGFIHHRLGINNFKITLENTLKQQSDLELNWWMFDKDWSTLVNLQEGNGSREKQVKLYPDAFFALYSNHRQQHAYFFLEIDTGSEDHTKLIEKMKRYTALAKGGQLAAPYPPEEPIKGFRVLFVMHSEARRQNLLKRAHPIRSKKGMFHIGIKDEISPTEPDKLLTPIWRTLHPKTDGSGRPVFALNGRIEFAAKSILE